jgi:hypothetical protein
LRRELCTAERFSEIAIFFALVSLNTPCLRSSASLSFVTRCDQRFGEARFVLLRAVVLRLALVFRAPVFRECVVFLT